MDEGRTIGFVAKGGAVFITFQAGGRRTVDRAASLLALAAKQQGSLVPLLVGCATVVLASALDRATKVGLDFLVECSPYDDDIKLENVRSGLADRTLESRVRRLPDILSNGVFEIHFANAHGKDITRL